MDVWTLVATALVIFMSIPGVALFYGGLVGSKNVNSILIQAIAIVGVVTVTMVLFGNGIVNAGFGGIFSDFLLSTQAQDAMPGVLFGFTFAIITPILIIGGFAERVKLPFVLLFSAIWTLAVYCPFAYWVWVEPFGDNAAETFNLLLILGTHEPIDWAGGLVVHQAAGVAALVLALVIGPRKGKSTPHFPGMVFIGAAVLWVGWFGFNSGINEGFGNAGHIMMNTQIAAATAALAWVLFEAARGGRPTLVGAATGAIAGLVAITPACYTVSAGGALVLGIVAGIVPQLAIGLIKNTFKIDDSLDVFAVHGVAGIVGTLLLPFLAAFGATSQFFGSEDYNMFSQFWDQLASVLISLVYNVVVTLIIAYGLKFTLGIRVSEDAEAEGLDITSHGERAYDL